MELRNRIIRFADDFVVVCNHLRENEIVRGKIIKFLNIRSLEINNNKILCFKWKHGSKFDFLGFTFHYLIRTYPSRITKQRNNNNMHVSRGGLYVYPSNKSVSIFKTKIKITMIKNLNLSPYHLILILNPIIRGWGNYFGVGTLRIFSRIDGYIWFRSWRYLRRKFGKVKVSRIIERFYKINDKDPWHFHGTWNNASLDTVKRKRKIIRIIRLTKLNAAVPAHDFRANNFVLSTSYYINPIPHSNWWRQLNKKRSVGIKQNDWDLLYNRQNGLCPMCGTFLGYFNERTLEIHHLKQVSKFDNNSKLINDINNLMLLHKECHKTIRIDY